MSEEAKGLLPEELEALTAIITARRENEVKLVNATVGISQLEEMKNEAIKGIAGNDNAFDKLREQFEAKYGSVHINVQTGEFMDAPEETVEE